MTAGGTLVATCLGAGVQLGLFDAADLARGFGALAAAAGAARAYEFAAADERRAPLSDSAFEVAPQPTRRMD